MNWPQFILDSLEALGELITAHLAADDEGRHQAVLRLNRLTADAIAQRVL
jgi:hypothetical protein